MLSDVATRTVFWMRGISNPIACYLRMAMRLSHRDPWNGGPMKRTCTAHRSNGEPCKAYAIKGGTVCRSHGGSARQVKEAARRRLLELVDPALVRLDRMVRESDDERVVLAAVKEILTRAGIEPPIPVVEITMEMLEDEIARMEAEIEAEENPGPPRLGVTRT